MDYCGHLMKKCYETKEFMLPVSVLKIDYAKGDPLSFSDEENEVNLRRCQKKQFYDQNVCRHLCSTTLVLESTRTNPISPCESVCFELTKSSDSAGKVCPFQKYCSNGCPCPFYDCEKFDSRQKMIPVFNLKESENTTTPTILADPLNTESNGDFKLITGRQIYGKKQILNPPKIILSNFDGNDKRINLPENFVTYECF